MWARLVNYCVVKCNAVVLRLITQQSRSGLCFYEMDIFPPFVTGSVSHCKITYNFCGSQKQQQKAGPKPPATVSGLRRDIQFIICERSSQLSALLASDDNSTSVALVSVV